MIIASRCNNHILYTKNKLLVQIKIKNIIIERSNDFSFFCFTSMRRERRRHNGKCSGISAEAVAAASPALGAAAGAAAASPAEAAAAAVARLQAFASFAQVQ